VVLARQSGQAGAFPGSRGKRGQSPFVRSTLRAVPANGDCPLFPAGQSVAKAVDPKLGPRYLYCEGDVPLLFTENETNTQRIFGVPNRTPYVKDSINDYVVGGQAAAVNPEKKAPSWRPIIA